MLALAVGSGAMIILFSVFNGFEGLIKSLYTAFSPEIRIEPTKGKFFQLSPATFQAVAQTPGVQYAARVLEDNVLLSVNDLQRIATLKGVDENYARVNNLKPYIYAGRERVATQLFPTALVGLHIANELGLDVDNIFIRLMVFYPNGDAQPGGLSPAAAFNEVELKPDGIFRVQEEVDRKYVLAPLSSVQQLFGAPGAYSSLDMKLEPGADPAAVRDRLQRLMGDRFRVLTRYEQNKTLFSVMASEKWVAYALLSLVLLIASFNMVAALGLLVLEKKKDMSMLRAMGATERQVRAVFLYEGLLWSIFGGGSGMLVGLALCMAQSRFGWIKLQGQFIIESYPVAIRSMDVWVIAITVVVIGLCASVFPALKATRTEDASLKST